MDITTYCETLNGRMQEQLGQFDSESGDLVKISQTLTSLRELIGELKAFVRSYRFTSADEEVRFFKELKPAIVVQYIYYKKVFAVRLFDSFNDATARGRNYSGELRKMEAFIRKNIAFYQYCLSGSTDLDKEYFVRGCKHTGLLTFDETFSTGYDGKLAKILAYELLKIYFNRLLLKNTSGETPKLTWTGTKTDLIELVYALQASGAIDHGNATIKMVAAVMEGAFNVQLGDTYRTFQDIRIRKKNQTPFLDRLKQSITQKINSF